MCMCRLLVDWAECGMTLGEERMGEAAMEGGGRCALAVAGEAGGYSRATAGAAAEWEGLVPRWACNSCCPAMEAVQE